MTSNHLCHTGPQSRRGKIDQQLKGLLTVSWKFLSSCTQHTHRLLFLPHIVPSILSPSNPPKKWRAAERLTFCEVVFCRDYSIILVYCFPKKIDSQIPLNSRKKTVLFTGSSACMSICELRLHPALPIRDIYFYVCVCVCECVPVSTLTWVCGGW